MAKVWVEGGDGEKSLRGGDRTCRGVARRCRMNENARTFVYTSLRPCAVLCLVTQSRPTLATPWTGAR